jgi:hypothetical protein
MYEKFKTIQVLQISNWDIVDEWLNIINGIVLIPSPDFRKLELTTESPIEFNNILQLASAVNLLPQQLLIEVRCEKLSLRMDIVNGQPAY